MKENATAIAIGEIELEEDKQAVSAETRNLFSLGSEVTPETGITNEFSNGLAKIIVVNGDSALHVIEKLILQEETPLTIAAEALRYIGNIESREFVEERRRMIERCLLQSPFVLVRDGAAAGLSYINDPKSIPILQRAIEKEEHSELKEDLVTVLHLLQVAASER